MDLSVDLGSLSLENPVIAASGTFGYGLEYRSLVCNRKPVTPYQG
jgi:dihydroorotate dehydrogenase (NAD+) catalytic subunit